MQKPLTFCISALNPVYSVLVHQLKSVNLCDEITIVFAKSWHRTNATHLTNTCMSPYCSQRNSGESCSFSKLILTLTYSRKQTGIWNLHNCVVDAIKEAKYAVMEWFLGMLSSFSILVFLLTSSHTSPVYFHQTGWRENAILISSYRYVEVKF